MKRSNLAGMPVLALGIALTATAAFAQSDPVPTSGPAENGSPAWFMQGSFPDPGGGTNVSADGKVTVLPRSGFAARNALAATCKGAVQQFCNSDTGFGAESCLIANREKLTGECKTKVDGYLASLGGVPPCSHSAVCGNRMKDGVTAPQAGMGRQRVEWKQTMGYTYTYPYVAPEGTGGIPSVALDSKGDLWVFKRSPAGTPQLYEYGPDHKLIRTVGDDVIGHAIKAHGMAIDAHDNVWICDGHWLPLRK